MYRRRVPVSDGSRSAFVYARCGVATPPSLVAPLMMGVGKDRFESCEYHRHQQAERVENEECDGSTLTEAFLRAWLVRRGLCVERR